MSDEARAEAERLLAAGELYSLHKSRITTFIEGAEWQASRKVEAAPSDSDEDERILAWMEVADHEAFAACYEEERPLIESVMDRLTYLVSMEQAVTELIPSQPVQVEVTDEMVLRALNAESPRTSSEHIEDWHPSNQDRMRAALTAALTPPVTESEGI